MKKTTTYEVFMNSLMVPRVCLDQINNSMFRIGADSKDLLAQSAIASRRSASSEIPLAVACAVAGFFAGNSIAGTLGSSLGSAVGFFAGLTISDTIGDRIAYSSLGGTAGSTITKEQMNSLRSIRMREVGFITIPLMALFSATISSAQR